MKRRAVYLADTMADVRMLDGLSERFELTVVVPAALGDRVATADLRQSGVRRITLSGGRIGFMLRSAAWLVAHRRAFDVILVLDNLTAALAANAAGALSGRPVILQLGRPTERYFRCKRDHGGVSGGRFWLGLAVLKLLVALNERSAAGIGATSEHVAKMSRRPGRRVVSIPAYGVDVDAFTPAKDPQEERRALGLPERDSLVLFRSRLAPEKDPDTFLRALGILRREGRDVTGLFVGAEYKQFEALAARMNVPVITRDHVHPLGELPHYYAAASVTVQTSHEEGLGMSPLESLACETPTVVTRVGGLVEVACGGETAMLVPPRDPGATARAIAWVLDHPDEAKQMARRGRQAVIERYTTERAFAAWERLAEDVITAKRRRR